MKNKVVKSRNTLSKEEQLELFKEYRKTLNRDIRNKIIEANIDLVFKLVKYYLIEDYYKKEELISYAYEGLILAVENYNPSLEVPFKVFASGYIKYTILSYLPNLSGFKKGNFFTNFMQIKVLIETERCEKLNNNPDMVDQILNYMIESKMINKNYYLEYRNRILITLPIYFDSYNYLELMTIEDFLYDIELRDLKNNLEKIFLKLTNEEELIIKLNFGFIDFPKSPKEIAEILDIDIKEVYYIKKLALHKLKRFFKNEFNLSIPSSFNLDKYENINEKKKKL